MSYREFALSDVEAKLGEKIGIQWNSAAGENI